jgi:hypothetical protein
MGEREVGIFFKILLSGRKFLRVLRGRFPIRVVIELLRYFVAVFSWRNTTLGSYEERVLGVQVPSYGCKKGQPAPLPPVPN